VPQPAANGDWLYNKHTGQIQHITNWLEKIWFEARSDTYVSFNSEADAKAWKAAYEASKKGSGPSPVKDWWLNTEDGTITHDPGADLKSPWMSFGSEAEAKAYLKAHPPNLGLGGVGNTITSTVGAIGKLAGLAVDLEDGNMWISMGWIMLGLGLTGVGLYLLFKTPIDKAVGGA